MNRSCLLLVALALVVPALAATPVATFRDCPQCPEMTTIPDGTFAMGSNAAEKSWAAAHGANAADVADEAPQHSVSVRSFALGKYDVTRGEYAEFVRETAYPVAEGCRESSYPDSPVRAHASWRDPGFAQSDRDPVTCVSWRDAKAYVSWLNRKVPGGAYRLPTEAEWEYAARAGSTTRFWWGDEDGGAIAHAWYKANSEGRTHPVGSKPANALGLHDMTGNVWQWTEDCYDESYAGAPTDGSARRGADDCLRVDRGGSWLYPAWHLRVATRERNRAEWRDAIMGFRVAKTLGAPQPDDSAYARPGVLLEAGSTRLNFYCMGQGSPAVIFEAGYSDWSPAWVRVHSKVAQWTRACAYDRAGSGFSDPGEKPRSSSRIADELLAALRSAGIPGPYILVGHSYGGVNVRTFALRHMEETAGVVLIDGDSTDVEPAALQEDDHRVGREIVAAYSDCRDALAAGKSLALPAEHGHPAWECDRYLFRGLPEAAWSRELNDKVAELARTKVALFDALVSEMAEVPADEAWLREHRRSLGSRPVRVLSSGHHGGGPRDPDSPEGREYQRLVSKAQADWLGLTTNGKQVFASGSSEYIQLDEPDVVVQAIREVFEAARRPL